MKIVCGNTHPTDFWTFEKYVEFCPSWLDKEFLRKNRGVTVYAGGRIVAILVYKANDEIQVISDQEVLPDWLVQANRFRSG